jgi:hypothetical protein
MVSPVICSLKCRWLLLVTPPCHAVCESARPFLTASQHFGGVQLDVFALCFLLTLFRLVGTPIHIGERHRTHDLHSLPSSQTTVCSRAIDPVHFTWNRRHACNQAVVTRV